MNHYLFVYGTLRNEFDNEMAQYLNQHATFLQNGGLKGFLYDIGTYPGVVYDDKAETLVKGQIFELHDSDEIFKVLDPYEGIDDELYIRQVCPVQVLEKKITSCWVYLFNRPTLFLTKIESGDYFEYLKL